ncbi:MAG: Calx-beta domain-containing protein [Cyanobium sp.]
MIDSIAPDAPTLALASDLSGTVSQSQLSRNGGVVLVAAEAGTTVSLTFASSGGGSFNKNITGATAFVGVQVSAVEAAALKDGMITVSATATDAAGNISAAAIPLSVAYAALPLQPLGDLSIIVLQNGAEAGTPPTSTIFRINRTGSSLPSLSLRYSLTGNATAGVDYAYPEGSSYINNGFGTIVIPENSASADLIVPTIDNTITNSLRTITATLAKPDNYILASSSATATIADNDTAVIEPVITILSPGVISEGNPVSGISDSRTVSFAITLDQAATAPVSLSYGFNDGTAIKGSDYNGVNGSVTFDPGIKTRYLSFDVINDTVVENDEIFSISFSAINAKFSNNTTTASTTITILNDDQAVVTDPTQGVILTSSGTFSGTDRNDVLTGSLQADVMSGLLGDDVLRGLGGSDTLTGGGGADRFSYTSFSESNFNAYDRINDFRPTLENDRILISSLPAKFFNRGLITSTTAGTLSAALGLAYVDTDLTIAGNQALAANEAVMFTWGPSIAERRTYILVNNSDSTRNDNSDLFIQANSLSSVITQTGPLLAGVIFSATV